MWCRAPLKFSQQRYCLTKAIFDCDTPVISAVGHETDETIADLARKHYYSFHPNFHSVTHNLKQIQTKNSHKLSQERITEQKKNQRIRSSSSAQERQEKRKDRGTVGNKNNFNLLFNKFD